MDKKIDALNRIDKGEPIKNITGEFRIGTSMVSNWKEIGDFCFKMTTKDSLEGCKTVRKAKN